MTTALPHLQLRILAAPALALLLAAGCSTRNVGPGASGTPLRDIAVAEDMNPDPHIVEVNLTAAPMEYEFTPGKPTTVLAYNGMLPGPLIACNQGDRLIVHLTNQTTMDTTIHWHGVRLTPDMDGTHISQHPVPPGGTFTYDFTVPDAALFWYHPHNMGVEEVYRGLYGPLLVRGAGEPELDRERILMLSDIGLDSAGRVIPPLDLAMSQLERAMGIIGNTPLVNGQVMPTLAMQPGSRERWRIVNAAGARPFDLRLDGGMLTLIGTDGGLLDAPVVLDHVLLAPGERIDVAVDAPAAPAAAKLRALAHAHVHGVTHDVAPLPEAGLAAVALAGAPLAAPAPLPAVLGQVPALDPASPYRFIQFNAALKPLPDSPAGQQPGEGRFTFLINGKAYPDVPAFSVPAGSVELWEVENHSQMEHPFHVHGMRFQLLDIDGQPPAYGGWRDTVNLPVNVLAPPRVKLLVSFDGHPGRWLFHCHNLFHQENGMMAEFTVEP